MSRSTIVQPAVRAPQRATRIIQLLRLGAALVITAVMLFPFYWMVLTALSSREAMYAPGLHVLPGELTLENFTRPLRDFPVRRWMTNSLLVAVVVSAITVTVNLLAGFAFAKFRFPGRGPLFLLLLSTMMIPVQAIMVAQFKLVTTLGLYGLLLAVILPASASAFGIFLARQFFIAFPDELLEAAKIDGAGTVRTLWSIVLPLSRPLIAVLGLLTFMYSWNDFTWPLIALSSNPERFTMPLGLATNIKGQYATDYGAVMAMSLLMVTPMVVLFLIFQRHFVQGIARTGLK